MKTRPETKYRIVNTQIEEPFSCWGPKKETLEGIEARVPEFAEAKVGKGYYGKLTDIYGDALVLVAYHEEEPVGFAASYMNEPEYRYRFDERINLDLWIACVVPEHRGQDLMSCMIDLTEWWADDKHKGYKSITLKTFPRFPGMVRLAEKKGFYMTSFCEEDESFHYKKDLDRSLQGEFEKSEVFKRYSKRFDLDLSWHIRKRKTERIRSIEYKHFDRFLAEDRYDVEFESGRKVKLLWEFPGSRFSAGDYVCVGYNSWKDMAWSLHPGLPVLFEKKDRRP